MTLDVYILSIEKPAFEVMLSLNLQSILFPSGTEQVFSDRVSCSKHLHKGMVFLFANLHCQFDIEHNNKQLRFHYL